MTTEEINNSLIAIEMTANMKCDPSEPSSLMFKLNSISNHMGLASRCFSEAEMLYILKLSSAICGEMVKKKSGIIFMSLSVMERKCILEGICAVEKELMARSEKLYSSLVHISENLRTLTSFVKEEIKKL